MRTILRIIPFFAAVVVCASAVRAQSTGFKVIYTFAGGSDGAYPLAGLTVGKGGVLYGTTMMGGICCNGGGGAAFSLTPPSEQGGAWTESAFGFTQTTGGYPEGGLAISQAGVLYGTAKCCGPMNGGSVYSLIPPSSPGGSWTEDTLYGFQTQGPGSAPTANVVIGSGGTLFSTSSTEAAVFALVPPTSTGGAWTPHTLHVFGSSEGDGLGPGQGLVIAKNDTLYGTTKSGGAFGGGTVYSVSRPSTVGGPWTEQVLYSFCSGSDGCNPVSILAIGEGGVLYGTAADGGIKEGAGCGVVFSLTPPTSVGDSWAENIIHTFAGGPSDGCISAGGVVIGRGGILYGTTLVGGPAGTGSLYSLTPPTSSGDVWTLKILHSFAYADGQSLSASLVFGPDGTLYGTAPKGGTGSGTVFAFKP